jgi:hypothetical protein
MAPNFELLTVQFKKDTENMFREHFHSSSSANELIVAQLFSFFSLSLRPHQK